MTPPDGKVLDEPDRRRPTRSTRARSTTALDTAAASSWSPTATTTRSSSGTSRIDSVILWIDTGVTLFASRNPDLYQKTGNCGVARRQRLGRLHRVPQASRGNSPGIVGEGTIDGQGGEPLVGNDYSWWQMSYALREIDGSIGNPTLINLTKTGTKGFLLYRITLHNSPKFHVKLTSSPVDGVGPGVCDSGPRQGVHRLGRHGAHPLEVVQQRRLPADAAAARATPTASTRATNNIAYCGVIACNTISTGDDHIAIKGGHWVAEPDHRPQPLRHRPRHVDRQRDVRQLRRSDGVAHRGRPEHPRLRSHDRRRLAPRRPRGASGGLQRHPRQVRREPRRPRRQHRLRGRLHARHGQRRSWSAPRTTRCSPGTRTPTSGT